MGVVGEDGVPRRKVRKFPLMDPAMEGLEKNFGRSKPRFSMDDLLLIPGVEWQFCTQRRLFPEGTLLFPGKAAVPVVF